MDLLNCRISGTGASFPRRIVHTEEVARLCGISTEAAIKRSGVVTRHWLSPGEDALDLGVAAAREALDDAGLDISDIDVILNASGTPLQAIPDGGAILASALGLKRGSYAYSMHGTCLSFLFALREAAFLVSSGQARNVLIVSMEGGSRGLNFEQPESALLMGDAAGAAVVSATDNPRQGISSAKFLLDTNGVKDAEIRGGGTRIMPGDPSATPSDFLFDMDGLSLIGGALRVLPRFLESIEPKLSKGAPTVDRIVPHQTSRAGLELMSKIWPGDKVVVTLPEIGNTIASSIPIALHRARLNSGDRVLFVGTGAGTLYGGVIYQN